MYKKIRKLILNYAPTVLKTGFLHCAPFLYHLLEIKPSSCNIMITNRCNLKCIMCKQWRQPQAQELSTQDWKDIIKDLKENGIRNLHFTGGEPLLRKDFRELVSHAARYGFVVGLTTNGSLLNKDLLEDLVGSGLRSIAISLDALNNGFDRIRGVPNSFIGVKEAASLIAEMKRKKKIDAYINFTLMNDSLREFRDVKRFADELNLPMAICLLDKNSSIFDLEENKRNYWINEREYSSLLQGLVNFIRVEKARKPHSLLLNFPMIDFIGEYFRDPRQGYIPCVSSQDRIIIDPYGNLLGGCLSMGTFGNIKDRPFSELQREERYQRAKKGMFYKKCAGCSCGYQFNIRCNPGLLIKDLFIRIGYFAFKSRVWLTKS